MNLDIAFLLCKCYCFEVSFYVVTETFGSFELAYMVNMYNEKFQMLTKVERKELWKTHMNLQQDSKQNADALLLSISTYLLSV